MPNSLQDVLRNRFNALGTYQIGGGAVGIIVVIMAVFQVGLDSWGMVSIYLVALLFYVFSVLCGVLLIQKRAVGLNLSGINQILQLASFAFLGYSFKYVSGISFGVGVDVTNSLSVTFSANLSSWAIALGDDPSVTFFSFNLVAIGVLILIAKTRTIKSELDQLAEIGNPSGQARKLDQRPAGGPL